MARVRRRRLTAGQKLVIAGAAVLAVGFPAWLFGGSYLRQREAALDRAGEARVEGPPCPVVTEAEFQAQKLRAPKATGYEGVTFARQFGHMECFALRYGAGWGMDVYPVCQFTSPNVLVVTTPQGVWRFRPGPGQPATVATPHGKVRCVMGANFTIQRLMGN